MSKRLFIMVFMAALFLTFQAVPVLAGTVNFTFAHFIPPNEPGSEVGLWIAKEINEKGGDKVKAKYFHSGQMGNAIELVKKVRMGTIKAAFTTGNYLPDLNPKFGIGTLAYCMDTYAKWDAFLKNKPLRQELFTSINNKGLQVLDLAYFGSYGIATTSPVSTLEELKAMKMRTTQARYPLAFWKALGVNPVPMAWGDVFPALKQGVIDGTDQTGNVVRLRLADVCKNFTHTNHMIGLFFLVVNNKWWKGLDPEAKAIIAQAIATNMAKSRKASMELTDKVDGDLKAKGVKVINLSKEEMAKFKNSQKKVWAQFEPEIGKEWLSKVAAFAETVK